MQDHTGLEVVLGEIAACCAGRGGRLPEPLPFRDFVAQARLGVPAEEHERYFAGLLGDVTEPTAPFGLLDTRGDGPRRCAGPVAVGRGWRGGCGSGPGRRGVSPATVFHLVWARVLAAVSGRDDVVFGTVLFGRMHAGAGADRVPGPFINTLPVRVRWPATVPVAAAVAAMQAQLAGLLAHEHAPLAAGPAGQRGARAGAAVHLAAQLPPQPGAGRPGPRRGPGRHRGALAREHTNYPVTVSVDDTGPGSR